MLIKQFYQGNVTLSISKYLELKRKIKTLNGEQKNLLNKGLNINV